ncbi:unnamed protein product [Schistosoma margrebowiei]|uniref:Uncharacterized protein n=1 Tax=Schistosoma margrebowiei TaxID=48269 RepID=A0A183LR74_9TREM|nr:unnamed protein product [Schistosoma margrebowiei]
MDNPLLPRSRTNIECSVMDTSGIFERIMRPMHLAIWDELRYVVGLFEHLIKINDNNNSNNNNGNNSNNNSSNDSNSNNNSSNSNSSNSNSNNNI